jgi:DNA-binding MarR family transcriptional regulator
MAKIDQLSVIEKPVGSMKILMYLHQHDKATITNLLRRQNLNQRTTYSALGKLQKEGLIIQKNSMGFPVCKYYFLTDKGRAVAEQLFVVASTLAH